MPRPSSASVPVAVVGMACRLPGANDLEQFWQLLQDGRSTVQRVPDARLDRATLYDPKKSVIGKSYTEIACLVDYSQVPQPSSVFEATPEIAYQTLANVAMEASLDAGWDVTRGGSQNGGVYLGHTRASGLSGDLTFANYLEQTASQLAQVDGFQKLTGQLSDTILRELVDDARQRYPSREPDGGPDLGASIPAYLIGAGLQLDGPAISFNSACASSLNALTQAVRALQRGKIDVAVAGGSSFYHSDTVVLFSQAQSLSATGTRPFDNDADGLVVGEGAVVLILKRLDDAIRDRDHVHAVIRGIGISTDGKGKSLWAPRAEGQIEAVKRAYEHGLEIERLQYLEAHATSTQVGDATELKALTQALNGALADNIPLGSVKGNIGHTLEVAGIAGLLKTILCLRHETIPPAANVRTLNRAIPWDDIPFYVPREAEPWRPWSDGHPRRAAVNAFGIGGLNTHVVVDEHVVSRTSVGLMPSRADVTSSQPTVATEDDNAVAIVGLGAVLPGALSIDAFSKLLEERRDAKREIPPDRWDPSIYYAAGPQQYWRCGSKLAGVIEGFEYDWRRHKIPPKQIAYASPLQFMILDAVDQAFRGAGYDHVTMDRSRIGVIVGNCFGGQFALKLMMGLRLPEIRERLADLLAKHQVSTHEFETVWQQCRKHFLESNPALLDETGSYTASVLASRITKSFDFMGGAVALDAGHVSSGATLDCCVDLILSGDCELMVCIAGQEDLSPGQYESWGLRGTLNRADSAEPFTTTATGIVPGDGCGVLLLKRLSAARRDQDEIQGIIRGVGAGRADSLDQATRIAATRAIAQGTLTPADVTYIEAANCGGADVDQLVVHGLQATYGAERREPLLLGSLANQIGHLAAASGMAAACKVVHALNACQAPGAICDDAEADYVRNTNYMRHVAAPMEIPVTNSEGRLAAAVNCSDDHGAVYHFLIERGTKVDQVSRNANAGPVNTENLDTETIDGIVHFDATQRRKQRLREAANKQSGARQASPAANVSQQAAPAPATPLPTAPVPPVQQEVPAPQTPAPAAPPSPAPAPQVQNEPRNHKQPEADELEKFLVLFIVDETGYPDEMVELDADLEADLGIDSIKKAQMLGELRDSFHLKIEPTEDMSLDDFPTLRHILHFVLGTIDDGNATTSQPDAANQVPPAVPQPVSNAPTTASTAEPGEAAPPQTLSADALAEFMVQFIVEETGYPEDMVELDADLEADLGIDSIKKAQMLGETRDKFQLDLQVNDDLSLDDFPTLQHILNFLATQAPAGNDTHPAQAAAAVPTETLASQGATQAAPQVASPPAASSAAHGPDREELVRHMIRFVVAETGYPEDMVEVDADLEADLGIDSIKKAQMLAEMRDQFQLDLQPTDDLSLDDFPTLNHIADFIASMSDTPATVAASTNPPPFTAEAPLTNVDASPSAATFGDFMIRFVVDETGYPEEMVELDADLEADLGIDSIKKAQMLGEVRDHFQLNIEATDDLSLDDFPTLRHILDFVMEVTTEPAEARSLQ